MTAPLPHRARIAGDGTSYTGNNPDPVVYNDTKLYFRGRLVLSAIIDDIAKVRRSLLSTSCLCCYSHQCVFWGCVLCMWCRCVRMRVYGVVVCVCK